MNTCPIKCKKAPVSAYELPMEELSVMYPPGAIDEYEYLSDIQSYSSNRSIDNTNAREHTDYG